MDWKSVGLVVFNGLTGAAVGAFVALLIALSGTVLATLLIQPV